MQHRWRRKYLTWAWLLRLGALCGMGFEAWGHFHNHVAADPTLVTVYVVLLGLPSAVRKDLEALRGSRMLGKSKTQTRVRKTNR